MIGQPCCTPTSARDDLTPAKPHLNDTGGPTPALARPSISLSGGTFLMGTDYPGAFPNDGEGPVRPVAVAPFAIDTYPVTNRDFLAFIHATHYLTDSERFGWSFVFSNHLPPDRRAALIAGTAAYAPWWCKVPGASWQHPEGPGSNIAKRLDHPAVHISWNDAAAFAAWSAQQLPTEAQWEYAARAGLEQALYPWGDDLTPPGTDGKPRHLANLWQGVFPHTDTAEDGYAGTCSVDAFPPNAFGLYSITGNTWEWTADCLPTVPSPLAPRTSYLMKGGSFLCHASYCNRYRVAARTSNTADSAASNIGFRCVTNA